MYAGSKQIPMAKPLISFDIVPDLQGQMDLADFQAAEPAGTAMLYLLLLVLVFPEIGSSNWLPAARYSILWISIASLQIPERHSTRSAL